jgi:hypothetical protein
LAYLLKEEPQSVQPFLVYMNSKCCLTLTTLIQTLYLLQQTIKKSNNSPLFNSSIDWKLLLTNLMIIGEKISEDNYIHPLHILNTFNNYEIRQKPQIVISNPTKLDFLRIQLSILTLLDWKINMEMELFHEIVDDVMKGPPLTGGGVQSSLVKYGFIQRPLPALPKMILGKRPSDKSHSRFSWRGLAGN